MYPLWPPGIRKPTRKHTRWSDRFSKKGNLDNQTRRKLVKVVIDHLILQNDPSHKFPGILKQAAEEIVELFPGERMASYYIPYTRKTNSTVGLLPKGKLYSRWVNCKRAMAIAKTERSVEAAGRRGNVTPAVTITEKEKASYNSLLHTIGIL
ncbi:hypothetical protein NQ317_015528 [Molorchus minor]|uniref:Uncharacterized protein n=1 Tax=Molorchus minor TaxID=1323400 RepID=A0ABQ9JB04_9CUCU|nr:hypothetical protein NQ317_015528 [Molorchus minor]